MKLPRRQILHLAAGAAALPAVSRIARAQTGLSQSKTGTRLITLGTASGPFPRAGRAQSSNLLTVNGTHYVIDAGDGVARRLAKARYQRPRHRNHFHYPSSRRSHGGTRHADVGRVGRPTTQADQRLRPAQDRGAGQGCRAVFQHQRRDQDCRRRPHSSDCSSVLRS